MYPAEDVTELANVISKLLLRMPDNRGVLFRGDYKIYLVKNWKLWLGCEGTAFPMSFLVCLSQDSQKCKRNSSESANVDDGHHIASKSVKENESPIACDSPKSPLEQLFDNSIFSFRSPITQYKQNKSTACYYPMNQSEARYILELYGSNCHNFNTMDVPMFAFCKGMEDDGIVMMGKSSKHRIVATRKGIFSKREQYPKMETILEKQKIGFAKPKVEYKIYALYDILRNTIKSTGCSVRPSAKGVLAVECHWTQFTKILEKPDIDCTCFVRVQAVMGDENEGACAKFKDLKRLLVLYECLLSGQMTWPGSSAEKPKSAEKLRVFLNDLKKSGSLPAGDINKATDGTDFDSVFASFIMKDRADMDFTDHLWNILDGCSSYQELVNSLKFVFDELRDFPFVPYVYKQNMSTVGKAVRKMNEKAIVLSCLDSTAPIKYLLEMGIEKLYKDYTALFVGLGMVPYIGISSFLVPQPFKKAVLNLQKLHTVLEILLQCWCYFHFPQEVLSGFVRAALKHYSTSRKVDPNYVFQFPVSSCNLESILEKTSQSVWQVSLFSESCGYSKETVLHYSVESSQNEIKENKPYYSSKPAYLGTEIVVITDDIQQKIGKIMP